MLLSGDTDLRTGERVFISTEFLRGAGRGLLWVAEKDSSMSSRLSSSVCWLCLRELIDFENCLEIQKKFIFRILVFIMSYSSC